MIFRTNEEMAMMRSRVKWIPVAIVGVAVFVFFGGWVVMHLWNWLLPMLFGWRVITFWQALGMLVLCRILFGRWGGGPRSAAFGRGRHGWKKLTPEEKEEWRRRMRERCGMGPEEAAPSA
jgi:hypothetical protein